MDVNIESDVVVRGHAFEDTIDGYFSLRDSLRQLMIRQSCNTAFVRILHAPVMEIPGLAVNEPVPLYIQEAYAGMIQQMTVLAEVKNDDIALSGIAEWKWEAEGNDILFSPECRLAEPAYVCGIKYHCEEVNRLEDIAEKPPAVKSVDTQPYFQLQHNFFEGRIESGTSRLDGTVVSLLVSRPINKSQPVVINFGLSKEISQKKLLLNFLQDHR